MKSRWKWDLAIPIAFILYPSVIATAQTDQIVSRIDGLAWETGGFPPSNGGDVFAAVGTIGLMDESLPFDPENHSYTWYARDLVCVEETTYVTTHWAKYTGGTFSIFEDATPSNHDFGVDPPNSTSPSTFSDGTEYLVGSFGDFTLVFNGATFTGFFFADLTFLGGSAFPQLPYDTRGNWVFTSDIAAPGAIPSGYNLQTSGDIWLWSVDPELALEPTTWGQIKALYR